MMIKKCTKCGQKKEVPGQIGLAQRWCRRCVSEHQRAKYWASPEKYREIAKNRRLTFGHHRSFIKLKCLQCGKEYSARVDGFMKYCSIQCVGESQKRRVITSCSQCGKEIQTTHSRSDSGKGKFCSKDCADKSKIGVTVHNAGSFKLGIVHYRPPVKYKMAETRTCIKCGSEKPISEFIKDKTYASGVTAVCKRCVADERKRECRDLADSYIKSRLRYDQLAITKDTIEFKRQSIVAKRTLKELKHLIREVENESDRNVISGEQHKDEAVDEVYRGSEEAGHGGDCGLSA